MKLLRTVSKRNNFIFNPFSDFKPVLPDWSVGVMCENLDGACQTISELIEDDQFDKQEGYCTRNYSSQV